MGNLPTAKVLGVLAGIIVLAGGGIFLAQQRNSDFTDGGVDVRNTACEDIPSARLAVATELEERKQTAQKAYDVEKEANADAYWKQNQALESEYHACISRALTADPCKEAFERIGSLYEEIMADFAADKGFNEVKFNERERAKEEYNKCVEDTKKPEFYPEKEAQCKAVLDVGKEANQVVRSRADGEAQKRFEEAVRVAEGAFRDKQTVLDAIEAKCNEPGKISRISIGALTTENSGATIQVNSAQCTGVFQGNDPELQRQLSQLESQMQKAKAGGARGGLFGTDHIQQAIDRVRQELAESPRTCTIDADCGSVEPVCCSGTAVGRAYCDAGTCAVEKTECVSPEICAGKPAQCVAPFMGGAQADGIYISRTVPEEGSCSQNLETLTLEQSTPDATRYSLGGSIPPWLHIDAPSGALPGTMNVTYSCDTVQAFGPGTYTVGGSVTVTNAQGELINTIPFNVSISVTGESRTVEVINYVGKLILVSELHIFEGAQHECDGDAHWHANTGSAKALDGTSIPDTNECGYGKTKEVKVQNVPETRKGTIEVRGLESLKAQ